MLLHLGVGSRAAEIGQRGGETAKWRERRFARFLIDWHKEGQLPFAALARATQTRDGTVAEAKQLLETSGMDMPGIARKVGYEDGGFVRRLFRRKVGLTPAAYRQRFRPFRMALEASAAAAPARGDVK